MALVTRDGRTYAYRSRRVGGKVKTAYVGAGEFAELWEAIERHERMVKRHARGVEAATFDAEKRRHAKRERKVIRADDAVEGIVTALLIATGHHKPNRGEWRVKRGRTGKD